jgi:uncharacterized protein YqgV (UPF0045/DUF77 family)
LIISAELSLYALGTGNFGLPVNEFIDGLKKFEIEVNPGSMSTIIIGKTDVLFRAIQSAFETVSQNNNVALVIKISNACPI